MDLNRKRRPGQSDIVSSRKESDVKVEFLSGLNENVTLGSPIGFIIKNLDQISKDYDNLQNVFRPSHADFTYFKSMGLETIRVEEDLLLEKQLVELWLEVLQVKFLRF